MNVSAGSIESSDIKIVIEEGHAAMQCMNMVPELTDRQVYEYVVPILKQYGLADLSPQIWFNGANEWVIRSRCEALTCMLNAALEREEVTG
ncbi:hypothetical protein [Paenibacillus sp. FSL M7-0420]|uniref:hypothetical protein n=1 Tax=Paenibacillus sp. FSL M7-0420 TaxID=2921609 RepID=UPI0030FBB060